MGDRRLAKNDQKQLKVERNTGRQLGCACALSGRSRHNAFQNDRARGVRPLIDFNMHLLFAPNG